MIATIYNEDYKEIGAADSLYNAIEFICMRAVMEKGKEIIIYVTTDEYEKLTSRFVARCEVETNNIKIDWEAGIDTPLEIKLSRKNRRSETKLRERGEKED